MKSAFIVFHSYELDDREETKVIGVYTTYGDAQAAVGRLKLLPGFKERPDDFFIDEYELNKDHWTDGYATVTTIMVKDKQGTWRAVSAAVVGDGRYEIIEKYDNDLFEEFKDGDIVRCEVREEVLYAIEKLSN